MNVMPSISSSTSRYRKVPSRVISYPSFPTMEAATLNEPLAVMTYSASAAVGVFQTCGGSLSEQLPPATNANTTSDSGFTKAAVPSTTQHREDGILA
jgi:hypothetical protein